MGNARSLLDRLRLPFERTFVARACCGCPEVMCGQAQILPRGKAASAILSSRRSHEMLGSVQIVHLKRAARSTCPPRRHANGTAEEV